MIKELAKMIDHSVLHPTFTDEDLKRECAIAVKYDVASVCVKPYMVPSALRILRGTDVKVGCVVGFPAGNSTTSTKVYETREACENGAAEIDMVINIGKALSGQWHYVADEIAGVTRVCHEHDAIVKVIFETDYVTKEEDIKKLCQICTKIGVDYVKTSTGFGFVKGSDGKYSYAGATIPNLELMKKSCGSNVKIKAAGGVRTLDQLLAVRDAGCSRSGATATVAIMEAAIERFGKKILM